MYFWNYKILKNLCMSYFGILIVPQLPIYVHLLNHLVRWLFFIYWFSYKIILFIYLFTHLFLPFIGIHIPSLPAFKSHHSSLYLFIYSFGCLYIRTFITYMLSCCLNIIVYYCFFIYFENNYVFSFPLWKFGKTYE